MMKKSLAVALVLWLAACASPGDLTPHANLRIGVGSSIGALQGGTAASGEVAADWWKAYGDAQLDALVDEALRGNPDMRIAAARVARAQALAGQVGAALQPGVSANASVTRQRYSAEGMIPAPYAGNYANTAEATLDFSFELDFWGRNRARFESALAAADAARLEQVQARLVLVTAILRSYAELDHRFALRELATETVAQRTRIGELTSARLSAGLETRVELKQTEAAVHAARVTLEGEEERITLLRHQLAVLAGAGPERGDTLVRPRLAAPPALPPAVPADLVGRRPDIQARLARARSAGAASDAARAAFYPNVNLMAFFGLQSIGLDRLLRGDSAIAGVTPALSLPILDGGRLRAGLAAAYADQDEAVEQYNAAVLGALQDVADRLGTWRALDRQRAEQEKALAAAEEAWRLAMLRYREGLSNYLTVLSAETQVLEQRRQGVDLAARTRDNAIELTRALGGGLSAAADAAART